MRSIRGYKISSVRSKDFKSYDRQEEAEKRLRQIEDFRHDQGERVYNESLVAAFSDLFGDSLSKKFN